MVIKNKALCNSPVTFWFNNPEFNQLAANEGWGLFECLGSKHGKWQIQELDDSVVAPDDSRAWKKVLNGDGEHHKSALAFIRYFNPNEYNRIINC